MNMKGLIEATQIATRFKHLIESFCEKIEIAGSIRRKVKTVGDIEIVVVPKTFFLETRDMFDNLVSTDVVSLLDAQIEALVESGEFAFDTETARNGERYKRFVCDNMPIDLFIAAPDNYGNILAIRTGNANFSQLLVTHRNKGGLMPSWMHHKDGYLWNGNAKVICRTEEDFFSAIGIPFINPADRHEATVKKLRSGLKV